MAQVDEILNIFDEVKNLAKERDVNDIEAKDALLLALRQVYKKNVFFTKQYGLTFEDGSPLPPKSLNKLARRIKYEIGRIAVFKKYQNIKKQLKESKNIINAQIASYIKNSCIVIWNDIMIPIEGSHLWVLKEKPKTGDFVQFYVSRTLLEMDSTENPITIDITLKNKKFLQEKIEEFIGVKGIYISYIDLKKIYIDIKNIQINSQINEKLLSLPYRVSLDKRTI